jgi:hypothetical protein
MSTWPFAFIGLPIINFIARGGFDEANGGMIDDKTLAMVWVGIFVVLALTRIGVISYS